MTRHYTFLQRTIVSTGLAVWINILACLPIYAQSCCDTDGITQLCYLSSSQYCLNNGSNCYGYSFDGQFMQTGLTQKLQNLANYGPAGIVNANLQLIEFTPFPSSQNIIAAGCDIVFVSPSFVNQNGNADSDNSYMPAGVVDSIRAWSLLCPSNLVIVTQAETEVWGYNVLGNNQNPNTPEPGSSLFSIFDGPFGSLPSFNQGGSYQGVFDMTAQTGHEILARDGTGRPTVVRDFVTNDILLADIGILCSGGAGPVSNGGNVNNNNDILACNIFNYASQITIASYSDVGFKMCPNENYILPDGSSVNTPGIYIDTLLNAGGCDSIIRTELALKTIDPDTITYFGCVGDGYTVTVNNVVYNEDNPTGSQTMTTPQGCDSTIVVQLNYAAPPITVVTYELCPLEYYTTSDGMQHYANKILTDLLQTSAGCDSILQISLIRRMIPPTIINYTGCQGDGYAVVVKGVTYNEANPTGSQDLKTEFLCDSMVTVNLTFLPPTFGQKSVQICQGDTLTLSDGRQFTNPGVYVDTLVSAVGCDSLLSIAMSFYPASTGQKSVKICEGDTLTLTDGRLFSQPGVYIDTLVSALGCDSLLSVSMSFFDKALGQRSIELCKGDTLVLSGNRKFTQAGLYPDSLISFLGCDSIVSVTLTYRELNTGQIALPICPGDTLQLPAGTIVTLAGKYEEMLDGSNGCDSILTVFVYYDNDTIPNSQFICINDSVAYNGITYFVGDTYSLLIPKLSGCDSVLITEVLSTPNYIAVIDSIVTVDEDYSTPFDHLIHPAYEILWTPSIGLSCDDCDNPLVFAQQGLDGYLLTLTDPNDCQFIYPIQVEYDCKYYMPNAFYPESNTLNSTFKPFMTVCQPENYEISIFDRWGNQIFVTQDPMTAWDGSYNGKIMEQGVYVYYLKYNIRGRQQLKFGDVLLVR